MPLFNFLCSICGNKFEAIEKIGIEISECPKCKYPSCSKIFSGTRFATFKKFICNDLGPEPVEITSWKHLEDECKKRGVSYEVGPTRYTRRERPREKLKKRVANAINENYA